MTKYDDIVGLGDETAEMLLADDEDHNSVVKGEAEIVDRLAGVAAAIDASLKDDLLLIQEHVGDAEAVVEELRAKKRKLDDCESAAKGERATGVEKLGRNNDSIGELRTEKENLGENVKHIGDEVNGLVDRLRKELAVAKSKLRIYSSVTGIEWDSSVVDKECIAGVFTGESRAAPFNFDKRRKSSFEITNALWKMIDEDDDDDW